MRVSERRLLQLQPSNQAPDHVSAAACEDGLGGLRWEGIKRSIESRNWETERYADICRQLSSHCHFSIRACSYMVSRSKL